MKTHLEYMEAKARDIGKIIGSTVPKDVGFVLTLANFGEGGWLTYLSNQDRGGTIKMLREMVKVLEGRKEKLVSPFPGE